ncbi:MAG: cyclopropane-fatty-acyl-phospholipid synthase family protein [Pseudomonadota bacterium]
MNLEQTQSAYLSKYPLTLRPLLRACEQLRCGELTIATADGQHFTFKGVQEGPRANLIIHHPLRVQWKLLNRGDIGFAEAIIEGDCATPDLQALMRLALQNDDSVGRVIGGHWLAGLLDRLRHLANRNNRRGSRRNIRYHYDLGNDFYRLWLDPTMSYSAALFAHPLQSLDAAQGNKYRRLLNTLEANPSDDILEIGCGWGGFASLAARRGHRVTGITLSQQQLRYARETIALQGLDNRVEFKLLDYRDLHDRQFDHIVSIEMFEAVGERYWPQYFQTLKRSLKSGGRVALQTITIDDALFGSYRKKADFIQLHIFPGGMLPSPEVFARHAAQAGLRIVQQDFFGEHYAETLRRWRENFHQARDSVVALGFDEPFMRLWDYYLNYCEAGFRSGRTNLMQVVLEHSDRGR